MALVAPPMHVTVLVRCEFCKFDFGGSIADVSLAELVRYIQRHSQCTREVNYASISPTREHRRAN